jgi:hypothetical protein
LLLIDPTGGPGHWFGAPTADDKSNERAKDGDAAGDGNRQRGNRQKFVGGEGEDEDDGAEEGSIGQSVESALQAPAPPGFTEHFLDTFKLAHGVFPSVPKLSLDPGFGEF